VIASETSNPWLPDSSEVQEKAPSTRAEIEAAVATILTGIRRLISGTRQALRASELFGDRLKFFSPGARFPRQ
jgi:hypothetical protein